MNVMLLDGWMDRWMDVMLQTGWLGGSRLDGWVALDWMGGQMDGCNALD